ncbi:MAG: D-aminoacyl-tRNA deacylase [Rikenellaceae bacterium]
MRLVIQRVLSASVTIDSKIYSSIGAGLMVLVGIEAEDNQDDIEWLTSKLVKLRIFDDESGVMNLDVMQVKGEVMVVSQFTLQASTKKGNRPSYIKAAGEAISRPLYNSFVEQLSQKLGGEVATGQFGADMQISLINNGPVTILIDSKSRE